MTTKSNCPRCDGLLVQSEVFDLQGKGEEVIQMLCIICGNRIDPVILVNQALPEDSPARLSLDGYRHYFPQLIKRKESSNDHA